MTKVYILSKQTRDHDRDNHWVFSTEEKANEFMKKYGFYNDVNSENYYEVYEKTLDPESEYQ